MKTNNLVKKNNLSKIYITIFICIIIIIIIYYLLKYIQYDREKNNNKNKKYIFCYGSLTSIYIQKVLLKNIKTLPPKAILLKESGYKRMWIEGNNNGVSLGIFQTNNPRDINGILLEFDESEFADFNKYETDETQHIPKKISWKHIQVENKSFYENNDLYIYVVNGLPKKAKIVDKMPNLYAQTVMEGFYRYGEDYLDLFLSSTE